jgi:oligopeptide/dipeptide ABC transporter ATP-binding protein
MGLIKQIKKTNNTAILLITHDLALVSENADKVAVMYSGKIVEQAESDEFFKNPKHPYSVALLNSLPTMRGKTLDTIKGQPPSINEDISGCRFHPRCKNCLEICKHTSPNLVPVFENHLCACHLYD